MKWEIHDVNYKKENDEHPIQRRITNVFFFSLFPFYSCEFQFGVSYRETHNNAVRFHFVIRQSLGAIGERLYLHCNVTICRRKDAPEPTIFNCFTHGEYCPNKTAELITKGPFVVWPFITKEERDKLKKQSSKRCYYSTIMSSFLPYKV